MPALSHEFDKATLEDILLEQPVVNVYAVGDLHPSCSHDCVWDGLREQCKTEFVEGTMAAPHRTRAKRQ